VMLRRIQNSDLRIFSNVASRAFRISTGPRTSLLTVCLSHFCSRRRRRVRTFDSIIFPIGLRYLICHCLNRIPTFYKSLPCDLRRSIALPSITTDHRATNPSGGPDEQRPTTTRDQQDKRHNSVFLSPTKPRDKTIGTSTTCSQLQIAFACRPSHHTQTLVQTQSSA
jgi:hypothetical protein